MAAMLPITNVLAPQVVVDTKQAFDALPALIRRQRSSEKMTTHATQALLFPRVQIADLGLDIRV